MGQRKRLDVALVEKGLAPTRSKAHALILAGHVQVDGQTITEASRPVLNHQSVQLLQTHRYVSRGGLKLEAALRGFEISPRGRICLDVGASTGGFTDCLLQHGARQVMAIDVGKGQMDASLRRDPRVTLWEKTNFRYFDAEVLQPQPDLVTVDVSFISLDKILPNVRKALPAGGEAIVLVKPQFEAGRGQAKKGVVRDDALRQAVVDKVSRQAERLGFRVGLSMDCPIPGPKGNREIFLHLIKPPVS